MSSEAVPQKLTVIIRHEVGLPATDLFEKTFYYQGIFEMILTKSSKGFIISWMTEVEDHERYYKQWNVSVETAFRMLNMFLNLQPEDIALEFY